jgi:predicted porin
MAEFQTVRHGLRALAGCTLVLGPILAHADDKLTVEDEIAQLRQRLERLENRTPSAPFAPRSELIVYGKLDVFAEYDGGGSRGTRIALDSGGLNGTRWGIKGGQRLTEGMRAVFQLEGGIYANTGQSSQGGRLFGRQAYAGVEGAYGRLTAGRQFSPMYNTAIAFDPFRQGYGSPTNDGNVSTGPTRYDSALVYAAPSMQGLDLSAMTAFGNGTGNRHGAQALAANFTRGPLGFGAAYLRDDHSAVATASQRNAFLGTSYEVGATRVMAGIAHVRTTPDGKAVWTRRDWMAGTQTRVTPAGQLLTAYGETRTGQPGERARVASAGWIQALAPESRVYAIVSRHLNGPNTALVPIGTTASSSYLIQPGDAATGVALGFQYDF